MPKLTQRQTLILFFAIGLVLGTSWITFAGGLGILIAMIICSYL